MKSLLPNLYLLIAVSAGILLFTFKKRKQLFQPNTQTLVGPLRLLFTIQQKGRLVPCAVKIVGPAKLPLRNKPV